MHVVFVADGFEQVATPTDAHQNQLVAVLNLPITSAPVLVACRQEEVWDAWYAGRVSVCEAPVAELDELLQGEPEQAEAYSPNTPWPPRPGRRYARFVAVSSNVRRTQNLSAHEGRADTLSTRTL